MDKTQLEQYKEENYEKLDDYFWTNEARHNEDFDGRDMFIDSLTEEEVKQIIK